MTTSIQPTCRCKPFPKRAGRDIATYEEALTWTLTDWEKHCPSVRAAGMEFKRRLQDITPANQTVKDTVR